MLLEDTKAERMERADIHLVDVRHDAAIRQFVRDSCDQFLCGFFRESSNEDAFRLSEFVKMMEELSGERIGCVEEILIRRGVAEYEDIVGVCDNDTRRYLKELFQ